MAVQTKRNRVEKDDESTITVSDWFTCVCVGEEGEREREERNATTQDSQKWTMRAEGRLVTQSVECILCYYKNIHYFLKGHSCKCVHVRLHSPAKLFFGMCVRLVVLNGVRMAVVRRVCLLILPVAYHIVLTLHLRPNLLYLFDFVFSYFCFGWIGEMMFFFPFCMNRYSCCWVANAQQQLTQQAKKYDYIDYLLAMSYVENMRAQMTSCVDDDDNNGGLSPYRICRLNIFSIPFGFLFPKKKFLLFSRRLRITLAREFRLGEKR